MWMKKELLKPKENDHRIKQLAILISQNSLPRVIVQQERIADRTVWIFSHQYPHAGYNLFDTQAWLDTDDSSNQRW